MSTSARPQPRRASTIVSRVNINAWVGQEDGDDGVMATIAGAVKRGGVVELGIPPVDIEGRVVLKNLPQFFHLAIPGCIIKHTFHSDTLKDERKEQKEAKSWKKTYGFSSFNHLRTDSLKLMGPDDKSEVQGGAMNVMILGWLVGEN